MSSATVGSIPESTLTMHIRSDSSVMTSVGAPEQPCSEVASSVLLVAQRVGIYFEQNAIACFLHT